MRAWLTRCRHWWLTAVTGGTVFVLTGCDPTVRTDVLNGVSEAATGLAATFIQAFFQALINRGQEDAATTVQVIVEHAQQIFA